MRFVLYLLCLIWCFSSQATLLYVDDDANGLNNGSCWQDAFVYLQDALSCAETMNGPVEIRVAQGVYQPDLGQDYTPGDRTATFHLQSNVSLYGGYSGCTSQYPDERLPHHRSSILSGDLLQNDSDHLAWDDPNLVNSSTRRFIEQANRKDNAYSVITSIDVDNTSILDGFTISGGHANLYHYYGPTDPNNPAPQLSTPYYENPAIVGAGLYNQGGSPLIRHCLFYRNTALSYRSECGGAGIFTIQGAPKLIHCRFMENASHTGDYTNRGGVILCLEGQLELDTCHFKRNAISGFDCDYYGTVLYAQNSQIQAKACVFVENCGDYIGRGTVCLAGQSQSSFSDCEFLDNRCSYGGAIHNSGTLTIAQSRFIRNTANLFGGAVVTSGPTTISNSLFAENQSDRGGAISASFNHTLSLNQTRFYSNHAEYGGALFLSQGKTGATIQNCRFRQNRGTEGGVAYHYSYTPGQPSLYHNCLFTENSAEIGGVFYNNQTEQWLIHCTVKDNFADLAGCSLYLNGDTNPATSIIQNCILWNRGDEFSQTGQAQLNVRYSVIQGGYPGQGNIDSNPQFITTGSFHHNSDYSALYYDNDFLIASTSPCINTGLNLISLPEGITLNILSGDDLIGNPRPDGNHGNDNQIVDMGAYEYTPEHTAPSP